MKDLTITETDTWTTAKELSKGDYVSVSVKGTWSGTIKVVRWPTEYGADLHDTPVDFAKHAGIIQEYTANIESVDISGGSYYYQIGTDDVWASGTAYVHLT